MDTLVLCAHGKPLTGYGGYAPLKCWRCEANYRFWLVRRLVALFR